MKLRQTLGLTAMVVLALVGLASAQSWAPLAHQPGVNAGPVFQLRDGRILMHEEQNGNPRNMWCLTPDASGSYANGTWSSCGQLQAGYAPFYFGSAVLLDGNRVVIEGGEYNNGSPVWTTIGSIGTRSGATFSWAFNGPPTGWVSIGDAQSVTLADGRYMQANCCTKQTAYFNGPSSWTAAGSVLSSRNDEQGWTLLGSGKVLTVDATPACGSSKSSELYDPTTNSWNCGPQTPVQLYNASDQELGAAVLMYNNKVFQFGGNVNATAIYDPVANTWTAGPTPPGGLDQADGPAALEPNGKVLGMLSPGLFAGGCKMLEYDPTAGTLTPTPTQPANCPADSSFVGHLLNLPTGQIMFTDFSGRVELYTPAAGIVAAAKPQIIAASNNLTSGSSNNVLYARGLNGLSQGSAYGDDYSPEANYPLVRLTKGGVVTYARTHDEGPAGSQHSIAPGHVGFTMFDLPTLAPGVYQLQVVAVGVASDPLNVVIH